MKKSKTKKIISWIAAIVFAIIMIQTLYFKFSSAPESTYIFSTLGIEPCGRIGSGKGELISSNLMLVPATRWLGSLFGLGIISGVILADLTKLGIEVQGDGGHLLMLALIVFVCRTIYLYLEKQKLKFIYDNFIPVR